MQLRMARGRGSSPPTLTVAGTPVTTTTQGAAYAGFTVAGSGGTPPYAYSVSAGTLPTGLTFNASTGVVSGTPSGTGTSSGIVLRVTDSLGQTADLASFSILVSAAAPANMVAPVVSGVAAEGETLTTDNGTWTNSPAGYTFQWKRGGTSISGAAASAYTLVTADVGSNITCVVTATNAGGSASATSNSVGPVAALNPPANSSAPVISGGDTEGSTLSATTGAWTNAPTSYSYQWKRGGSTISGATAATYTRAPGDIGAGTITCVVTATNAAGSATATSNSLVATVNGILARFGIRALASEATDAARATYLVAADGSTAVTRTPAGGIGSYQFAQAGYGGYQTQGFTDPMLAGYAQLTAADKWVKVLGIPTGTTVKVKIAFGFMTIASTNQGYAIWDGNPSSGGTKRIEGTIANVPDGYVGDASGGVTLAGNWVSAGTYVDVLCNSGEIWIGPNITNSTWCDLRAVDCVYPSFITETAGTGQFFVKPDGDNTKDGRSLANAWKNLPGDPDAVGGNVAAFVLLPGAVVNIEGGVVHKPAAFGARKQFMFQRSGGTSGSPIIYQPRSGSGEPILEGSEDLPFTMAATSADVNGNTNYGSITYETVAAVEFNQAPVAGGMMLRPAQFPKPSDISAYDDSDPGSDAFFAQNGVTGPSGSAALFTQGAQDTAGAGYRLCAYSGTRVLSHYGAVSIQNYKILYRSLRNQIDHADIVSHNTTTGAFEFKIPNADDLFVPTSEADFLWAIRYHPFDILAEGQYGMNSARTRVYGWFPASGVRGLCRLTTGVVAKFSDVQFNGITWRNFAGGNSVAILNDSEPGNSYHPNRIKISGKIRNTADYSRDYLINVRGGGSGWDLSDIDIADNFPKGGINLAYTRNSTINRLKARDSGRTLIYNGGTYPSNSQDNTLVDIDTCDGVAIHGNGNSDYQSSQRVKIQHWLGLNHVRPSTNQGDTAGLSRANEISYAALTGRLQPSGAPHPSSLSVITQDNNGKDQIWDHLLIGEGNGMYVGGDSAGMVIKNCYIGQLGSTNLTGVIFQNVVISTATGGSFTNTSQMLATGMDPSSFGIVFTSAAFDGGISALARQALTANGSSGTYSDVNIGMTIPGRQWNIPAYGTTFALGDPGLSTNTVRKGHRALLPFGQFFNMSPESVLSLPSGADNALFGLIRGKPYFLANAVAGTYTLRLLQTNASADRTGPSTRSTDFTITVA